MISTVFNWVKHILIENYRWKKMFFEEHAGSRISARNQLFVFINLTTRHHGLFTITKRYLFFFRTVVLQIIS